MPSFTDPNAFADPEDSELVRENKRILEDPCYYTFTDRDVILYNLGVGATAEEIQWVFEGDEEFQPIPTFGVVPQLVASSGINLDFLPDYNVGKMLHGEHYLAIKADIPTYGEFVSTGRILEVLDKGKAASVTNIVETRDKDTGELIFENQATYFVRGSGGFGGRQTPTDRGAATATNEPPSRKPDAVIEEKTSESQAALYRLSGDLNPLHIVPDFAAIGGFDKPILHGLCSMGISAKHVVKTYGYFKDIKVRFGGVLYPGETIVTEMWKEGSKVIFTAKAKERNTVVLTNAAATLVDADVKAKL